MTFDALCRAFRATPDERRALAEHLGDMRKRTLVQALAPKRCFTYCGDDLCTCEANPCPTF